MNYTIGTVADQILRIISGGPYSDDHSISLRDVGQLVLQEVAYFAKSSAMENSRDGEIMFSNDTFVSTYKGVLVQTSQYGEKFVVLPSNPVALPNNREIVSVKPSGTKFYMLPLSTKDAFLTALLPRFKNNIFYTPKNGSLYFDASNFNKPFTAVDIDMVATPVSITGDILDTPLYLPENFMPQMIESILKKLNMMEHETKDINNNQIDN